MIKNWELLQDWIQWANKPCLPFFFWVIFQDSLSHKCASYLPVHLCLLTPRNLELRFTVVGAAAPPSCFGSSQGRTAAAAEASLRLRLTRVVSAMLAWRFPSLFIILIAMFFFFQLFLLFFYLYSFCCIYISLPFMESGFLCVCVCVNIYICSISLPFLGLLCSVFRCRNDDGN